MLSIYLVCCLQVYHYYLSNLHIIFIIIQNIIFKMEKFKTLNNRASRDVIMQTINCNYRAVCYLLYNYRDTFISSTYDRLLKVVSTIIGDNYKSLLVGTLLDDKSISLEVVAFIYKLLDFRY